MATRFIEARYAGVDGTALLPETAFPYMPGWEPVDSSESVPSLVDGKVAEVLAKVGDDPAKARTALLAEQASSKPRSTLVEQLTQIADGQEA